MQTEKPVWNTEHISTLLCEIKNNIPERVRKKKWTVGMKALDWKIIAFKPFSPEECQQKWQEILQTISKVRTLPELIADAEDGISNPFGRKIINPEYPKEPPSGTACFFKDNFNKLKKEYPNVKQSKLLQYSAEKYKMLPEEEKRKYEENYKLAREEYNRRMAELRKHLKDERDLLLRCKGGFSLFLQEQRDLNSGVLRSDCQIKWKNFTESQRKEYKRRSKKLKRDKENNSKNSSLFRKFPRNGYSLFCQEQSDSMGDGPFTNYPAEWKRRWDTLTKTQKDKYHRQLKKMKREHAIKLNEFLEDFSVKKQQEILKKYNLKRPKLPKERRIEVVTFPGEPKKPPYSAHALFCSEQMMHLKELKKPKQRFSVVNQMWRHLSNLEKEDYEKKLDARVLQYFVEMQRWFRTLTPVEQEQYLRANPSKRGYFGEAKALVCDDKEVSKYQPSDSEDEDLEDSSSEDDEVIVEDEEEEGDCVMFDMF